MENDSQSRWGRCLEMIREKVGDARVFATWFADIRLERYDEEENVLVLLVPSRYVYEYIEQYGIRLMGHVLASCFKPGVQLRYRIVKEPAFAEVVEYLKQYGYDSRRDPFHVTIPGARKRMEDGLKYFLGDKAQWLPGYDRVVEWLEDNKGRGLLCVGTPGMGKTLVCQKILPVILGNGGRPIASVMATELHDRLEGLKKERIVIIDDLGKEPRKYFGNIDNSFFELCSNAERTGNLLIIITNLSTTPYDRALYPDSILERYGSEVYDRLKAVTKMVRFEGKSLRE